MKNYSSTRAKQGKTAYRAPSVFRYQQCLRVAKIKSGKKK